MNQKLNIPFQTFLAQGVNGEANFNYNNFTTFNALNWSIEVHSLTIINLAKEINCLAQLKSNNISEVIHTVDATKVHSPPLALIQLKSEKKIVYIKDLPKLIFPITLKNDKIKFTLELFHEDEDVLKNSVFLVHASIHRI